MKMNGNACPWFSVVFMRMLFGIAVSMQFLLFSLFNLEKLESLNTLGDSGNTVKYA